jgi:hypothetical protein
MVELASQEDDPVALHENGRPIDGHLRRAWARDQAGRAEEVEELLARQPLPPPDGFVLHHRDVRGRSAECGEAEPQEQRGDFSQPRALGQAPTIDLPRQPYLP